MGLGQPLKPASCLLLQVRPLPKPWLRQPRKPRRRQRRRHWQLQRRPRTSPARRPRRSSSSNSSLCSQPGPLAAATLGHPLRSSLCPPPCALLLKVNFQPDLLSGWWVGGGVCLASAVHQTHYPRLGRACCLPHQLAMERGAVTCPGPQRMSR